MCAARLTINDQPINKENIACSINRHSIRCGALRLIGMAEAFAQQLEQPEVQRLSFDERLALLVDRETTYRQNRRLQRLLHSAHFRQPACVEEIDFQPKRGLDRALIASLSSCDWIRQRHNLLITGATGTGKSWLACAFGQAACRQGLAVKYGRTHRLLEQLRIARGDGSYHKQLSQLAKLDLLILDDFGLKPLQQSERHDLLEMIEDRHGVHSTLITSQLPVSSFYEYLNEPTIADALLDRLLHSAHRLELKGESLRRKTRAEKV
jgi:DNA replication protein DnaC